MSETLWRQETRQKLRETDSLHRLQAVVSRIKYRPGWVLSVTSERDRSLYTAAEIRVDAKVMCAYDNSKTIPLRTSRMIPLSHVDALPEEGLVRFCFDVLRSVEMHELGEFFQYNGERPYDPHN